MPFPPRHLRPTLAGLVLVLVAAPVRGQATRPDPPPVTDDPVEVDPPARFEPLPERGPVPAIAPALDSFSRRELARRARVREYRIQLRTIRRNHFGRIRVEAIRAAGIARLEEFTDPAAFSPMIEELAREDDDVRLALLDHFLGQGDAGQGALAWVAIHDRDPAIRHEATRRMVTPPPHEVLFILDRTLRDRDSTVAGAAGALAGALNVLDAIPLLIMTQVASGPARRPPGDIAWIAIETQRAFVPNVVPVVGDNSGAFMPIISTISEGTVLRVMDAVVIEYRTEIHTSLVNMTSYDWGQSTAHLGYDMNAWWEWYNREYVPYKAAQARVAGLAGEPSSAPAPDPDRAP